jgi:hypothetical protein
VPQPPHEPPRLCRQAAITIAPDVGARYRQDLPYGSPAWHARYATLRNTIEGLNGLLKDTAHQALAAPARRRIRGIAACSLFTALLLVAANIRKIRAWRALTTPARPASPAGHGGAAPACATTSQTADSPQHPPPPRPSSPARQQPRPRPPERRKPAARARQNQPAQQPEPIVRPCRHNKKRSPAQFCRHDTGSSVGNPQCGRGDLNPHGVATNRT